MEAVGTSVGIASLGIQGCQGLLSYYDGYRNYDSEIGSTYAITDSSKTLTLLKSTLDRGGCRRRKSRGVKTCMKSCENALFGLKKQKRQGLQQHSTPRKHEKEYGRSCRDRHIL